MKLAEALVLRADLQKRIAQVRARVKQSVLVQEGEQPPEDPQALLAEAAGLVDEWAALVTRINRANLATTLPDGTALTAALAQRDALGAHQQIVSSAADQAGERIDRYGRSEIRKVATVDVAALRKQADTFAQRRRELDTAIQATNWATELAE